MLKKIEKIFKKQQQNRELNKTLSDLPHPKQLLNCITAAKQIVDWLQEGKRMLLVGDYDADGIMATTIVMSYMREAGYKEGVVDYIIPSRLKDGYGLSTNIIEYVKDKQYDFIVTVDNAISAVEAVKLSNSYGIPVIITDHHTTPEILPDAHIVVNPKQKNETFPYIEISGATVAWYLVAALNQELGTEIAIQKWLDYVAITILSDVMPLNDINLPLLEYGMKKIKNQERFIYKLIWNDWTAPVIDTTSISFNLVPKINALGRIDDANIGVKLFMSKKQTEIAKLHQYMEKVNEKRKEMSRLAAINAQQYIKNNNLENNSIITILGDYHEGIIGIVAGKIAEIYKKPTYVFTTTEDGILKGSARSIGNVHLYEITQEVYKQGLIFGFGGHKGAVGLSIKVENFQKFSQAINKVGNALPQEYFVPKQSLPIEITSFDEFNNEYLALINQYAPFGEGNPMPQFIAKSTKITINKELKNGLHYKCTTTLNNSKKTALFFNVKKEEFLEKIKNETDILINTSLSHDPRSKKNTLELLCSIV